MPITKSKVRDSRPVINASAESDNGLFNADVSKGTINLKRGTGRQPSFALKYEEVTELVRLLGEVEVLLSDNQYGTSDSLEKDYEPGTARYTPPSRANEEPEKVAASNDPTLSNEAAQAAGTTPAEGGEDNPFDDAA